MSTWDRLKAVADEADAAHAETQHKLENLEQAHAALVQQAAELTTLAEEQRARIAELEASQCSDPAAHAEPEPEPPVRVTLVGACPNNESPKNLQSVVARFGKGAHVRAFCETVSDVPLRPADASGVAITWNHGGSYTSRPSVEQYRNAARNLLAGDAWERQHESDKKVRDGRATFAQAEAALNDFVAKAKDARPDLLTMTTFTGWLFSPNPSAPGEAARNQWGPIAGKHDILGIDLDGVHTTPPPDYRGHRANWERFMDQFGIDKMAVPELGTRLNQTGMDEMDRILWWQDQHGFLADLGYVVFIDAFLWNMAGNTNDMTDREVAEWSRLVASTR